MSETKGILKITKYGFGKIITNDKSKVIKVDRRDLNNNFNGDEVSYIIKKDTGTCQYAEIVSEPNYKDRDFIGIIHHSFRKDVFIYNFNIGKSNLIMCDSMIINGRVETKILSELNQNNFVRFKITKYKEKQFYGRIFENYGSFNDDKGLSMYIVNFNSLNFEFPEKVIKKSEKCVNRYNNDMKDEMDKRKDLRSLNTFTIDPEGARDLDDALSIVKVDKCYKVYIHIADVSYFVKKGNSIDMEARKRSFSVYLPDRVIRMLPPLLSENLCSLLPDSDKYAVTTEVDIDFNGNIINFDIYKSIIKSDRKFSYENVFEILENNLDDNLITELRLLKEASKLLGKKRLKLPEKKLNNNLEIETSYLDYSHSMIEEMMILNNILVAKTLFKKGICYPCRYHGVPDYENNSKLIELIEKVNNLTFTKIDVLQLQSLVNVDNNTNRLINLFFIHRILSKAKYDCKESGHWALNLDFYSHFTSPIRRYPDLISHRLIFEDNYSDETLKKVLIGVNENETNYQQIEFYIEKVRKIRILNNEFEKNKDKEYDAYILDVRNPTLNIFIPSLFWSDEIHIGNISNKKLKYDDDKKIFYDEDTLIKEGMLLKVKIKKIKVAYLELEFEVNKI